MFRSLLLGLKVSPWVMVGILAAQMKCAVGRSSWSREGLGALDMRAIGAIYFICFLL